MKGDPDRRLIDGVGNGVAGCHLKRYEQIRLAPRTDCRCGKERDDEWPDSGNGTKRANDLVKIRHGMDLGIILEDQYPVFTLSACDLVGGTMRQEAANFAG